MTVIMNDDDNTGDTTTTAVTLPIKIISVLMIVAVMPYYLSSKRVVRKFGSRQLSSQNKQPGPGSLQALN